MNNRADTSGAWDFYRCLLDCFEERMVITHHYGGFYNLVFIKQWSNTAMAEMVRETAAAVANDHIKEMIKSA